MININFSFIIILFFAMTWSGCNTIKIMTSSYNQPKVENLETLVLFIDKHGIDETKVFYYDSSFKNFGFMYFNLAVFNKSGKYLDLNYTKEGCKEKNYEYNILKYLLTKGDDAFVTDSIFRSYYTQINNNTAIDPESIISDKFWKDTTTWNVVNVKEAINLSYYAPFIKDLKGQIAGIENKYTTYLIIKEFAMYGEAKLAIMNIKALLKTVERLNKEFDNKLSIILVSGDKIN